VLNSAEREAMNKAIKEEEMEYKFEGARRRLLEMQKNLMKESNAEINQILNVNDKYNGVSDDGDIADVACRDSVQAAQFTRHLARLRAIEEALLKIEAGTFGICEDCEEEISPGRMNAIPFAVRCVECQEKHEFTSSLSED
jgi:DnaK suppressor protein